MLGDPIQSYPTHGWTMAVSSSLHGMVHHDEFAGAFKGTSGVCQRADPCLRIQCPL